MIVKAFHKNSLDLILFSQLLAWGNLLKAQRQIAITFHYFWTIFTAIWYKMDDLYPEDDNEDVFQDIQRADLNELPDTTAVLTQVAATLRNQYYNYDGMSSGTQTSLPGKKTAFILLETVF